MSQKFVNPYNKTEWFDEIEDPITGEILEEGTVFSADRANNIEEGIHDSYDRIVQNERDTQRIRVQLDLKERANSELVFYDTMDGEEPRKMKLDTALTVVKEALSVGGTTLNVVDGKAFKALSEVTVFDGTNSEDVLITDITGNVLTVQALKKSYVKGAFVARTNAVMNVVDQYLQPGRWGTYSIAMAELV